MNTCPAGIATQDKKLRKRFIGKSEYTTNYFKFIAQEIREYLAEMGMDRQAYLSYNLLKIKSIL